MAHNKRAVGNVSHRPLVMLSPLLRRLCPKLRLQPKFKHRLNKATDVVAKHLTNCFVDLRRLSPATKRIPELTLDHVERGFRVTALMVVPDEPFLIVGVAMEHLCPFAVNGRRGVKVAVVSMRWRR